MGTILVPSVRIWRMPNSPDKICFATYHAKAHQFVKRPVVHDLTVMAGPLYDIERKRWRLLRKTMLEELSHLPVGGGVLLHVIKRSKWFNRGTIYGVGKTMDLAAASGYAEQADARCLTFYDAGKVEDHGRITIGEKSRFFWIEKAGETRAVERKLHLNSAKLWFKPSDSIDAHHVPGVGMGLRG